MQADGAAIRRRRIESGYGLNAFARRIDLSASYLSKIERGLVKSPSMATMTRIALGLDEVTKETAEEMAKARAAIAKITKQDTNVLERATTEGAA